VDGGAEQHHRPSRPGPDFGGVAERIDAGVLPVGRRDERSEIGMPVGDDLGEQGDGRLRIVVGDQRVLRRNNVSQRT
jgi:hypothetical protein